MNQDHKNWKNKMDQLKTHASPIDLFSEWGSLEKRMNQKKRRKFLFWFLPMTLASAGLFVWLYLDHSDTKVSPKKDIIIVHSKTETTKKEVDLPLKTRKEITNQKPLPSVPPTIANHVSDLPSLTYLPDNAETEKPTLMYDTDDFSGKEKEELGIQKTQHIQGAHISVSEVIVAANEHEVTTEFSYQPEITKNPLWESPTIADIKFAVITQLSDQISIKNPIIPLKKELPFFLDVRMLAGQSVYQYQNIFGEDNRILTMRQKAERPLETYGANLLFGKELGKSFYITAGVTFLKSNERWSSSKSDTTTIFLENQVTGVYTNHEGVVTETTGNKTALQISQLHQTRYNHLTMIAPTITIGKNFTIYKTLWSLEGILVFPVYSRFFGEVWDDHQKMTDIKNVYEVKNAVSYGGHLSYVFPVSGRLNIYGGYQYQFSRIHSFSGYFRNQHFHSLGLGMKYFMNL
jgi:hypothetical protein